MLIKDNEEYLARHLAINDKKGWSDWQKIRAKRTVNSGLAILDYIDNISFTDMMNAQYFKYVDQEIRPFIKKYEYAMEGAKVDRTAFLDTLDKVYSDMASEILNGKLEVFLDFVLAWNEKYITMEREETNHAVGKSYISLLMQQFDYLATGEDVILCGATTEGKPIYHKDLFPLQDLPNYNFTEKNLYLQNGKVKEKKGAKTDINDLCKEYQKYGYPVKNFAEIEYLNDVSQLWTNEVLNIAPLINEYTMDMICEKPFRAKSYFELPRKWKNTDLYKEELQERRYLLPSNGVILKYRNAYSIQELKMKELVKNDTVYMIYRVETDCGQLCGFYNTKKQIFYSPLTKSSHPEKEMQFENFILENYFRLTVKDIDFSKKKLSCMLIVNEFKDAERIGYTQNQPIAMCSYLGGKQRDFQNGTGNPETDKNLFIDGKSLENRMFRSAEEGLYHRYNRENYYSEQRSINGYIRKLPKGSNASEQSTNYAKQLGIELEQDETYVKPFIKHVLRVK